MKLYVARHGETNYNVLGIHNDNPDTDVHLTDLGIAQAEKMANELKDAPLEHIYISELKRTRQTAEIINKFHSVPVSVDSRIDDNRSGLDGKPDKEYYAAIAKVEDKWNARLNGGESLADVKARVQQFIEDLKKTDYKVCLVITSRIIMQTMYGIIKGLDNEHYQDITFKNGEWVELEITTD